MRKLSTITTLALTTTALAATALPAAADDVTPLIVGGRPATESYPWMASLQLKEHPVTGETGYHGCAAVAVEPMKLVTAGHCVSQPNEAGETVPMPIENFQIRVGSPDRKTGGQVHEPRSIEIHRGWDYGPGDDIAVIHTKLPMIGIVPISISHGDAPATAQRRIIGWGVTESGRPAPGDSSKIPRLLREQDAALVDDASCAPGSEMGLAPGKELCVGQPGSDITGACYGDSGGPLLVKNRIGRWELEGITSRGLSEPDCGVGSGIYTDAPAYKTWVHTH